MWSIIKTQGKDPWVHSYAQTHTETDRFNATPEEDRLCLLCELGETKNEVHFLFFCLT